MRPMKPKVCCLCGADAGKHAQHFNRDFGYGICGKCVDAELSSVGIDSVLSCYGLPMLHYTMTTKMKECSLEQAHKMGAWARANGSCMPSSEFNPFEMPRMLIPKLTNWDAFDSGFSGESYEAMLMTKFD